MTEETPKKKPRRKRRTKAEIEAEKAAKLAVDSPKEVKNDDVVVEMLEETVISDAPVKEETVESAPEPVSEPPAPYIPQTGINKIRQRLSQRRLREEHYEATRKKK